jgi:glucokinase
VGEQHGKTMQQQHGHISVERMICSDRMAGIDDYEIL